MVAPALVQELPLRGEWLHEVKFDGYRMVVRKEGDKIAITSRNDLNWTKRFPFLAKVFKDLPAKQLLMDGEVVSLDEKGHSDFGQLQADLADGNYSRIIYFAFDLMHLDGYDLTGVPLVERKRLLKELLEKADLDRIFYSEHFEDGTALYAQAAALGLEGVVSKKADSLYKPSKSAWQKVKCVQSAEYHIVGYIPSGSRHIGALRLGQKNGQTFDYVGKVGTGFSNEVSERLRKQLAGMHILKPSLTERLRKPDTKWVEPRLKAKVAFRGITGDGKLRHPSFKGLV
jgi:bifunctional non-homologous end joining protein LigD